MHACARADTHTILSTPLSPTSVAQVADADQARYQEQAKGLRSRLGLTITRYLKYLSFLNGALPVYPISKVLQFAAGPLQWLLPCYGFRRGLVNRYPAVTTT